MTSQLVRLLARPLRAVREVSPPVVSLLAIGLIGFVTSTLSARMLSPAGRGDLLAIQVVPLFLTSLSAGGVPEAILYVRPIGSTPSGMRRAAMAIVGRSSSVALLAGWAYLLVVRRSSAMLIPALFHVAIAPFAGGYEALISFERRARRLAFWSTLRLIPPLIWLSVLLFGLAVGTHSAALLSYLQVGLYGLMAVSMAARALPRDVPAAPDLDRVDLSRKSRAAVVQQVFKVLTLRLDLLLMPSIASNVETGWYATATSWSWLATPWMTGLSAALAPTLQRRARRLDGRLTRRLLLGGVAFSGLVGLGGWVATRLLFIDVFGKDYAPAIGVAVLLIIAGAVSAFNLWVAELARSTGRTWLPAVSEFPSVLVFLVVLFRWKASIGSPRAAAIGSLAGYLTTAVLLGLGLLVTTRRTGVLDDGA